MGAPVHATAVGIIAPDFSTVQNDRPMLPRCQQLLLASREQSRGMLTAMLIKTTEPVIIDKVVQLLVFERISNPTIINGIVETIC